MITGLPPAARTNAGPRPAPPAALRGRLELVFAPARGGTTVTHAHVTAPLKIVRPFALDDERALVQILTLGPGLCAGDCCAIDVTVEAGARAVVIMQSASRLLGMPSGECATQTVTLTVRGDGQLEYYPGLTIPFADSDFVQRIDARIDSSSRLGIVETWATGRIGRGEHLRFRRMSSRTTVTVDDRPVYADALELTPSAANVAGAGILEDHRYVASGFWHGAVLRSSEPLQQSAGTLAVFGTRGPGHVYLRALSKDGYALGELVQSAVGRINGSWDLQPIPLRRFTS